MPQRAVGKYLPVRWMFYFREALSETIGLEGTNSVLRAIPEPIRCPAGSAKDLEKSVDFSCYGAICASVADLYGDAGARRVLFAAGRTAFTRFVKNHRGDGRCGSSRFSRGSPAVPLETRMQSIVQLIGLVSDMECSYEHRLRWIEFRPDCLSGMRGTVGEWLHLSQHGGNGASGGGLVQRDSRRGGCGDPLHGAGRPAVRVFDRRQLLRGTAWRKNRCS